MKKFSFLLLAILCAALTVKAAHIRTVNGTMYFEVRLRKVTHKGLVFMHRDGIVTLTPDKLNRLDRKKYAEQIYEYNRKNADEDQRLFTVEVENLKKVPLDKRMVLGKEMLAKYRNRPFDLRELMAVVKDAEQKAYEKDMSEWRKMSLSARAKHADVLLKKYAANAVFTNELKLEAKQVESNLQAALDKSVAQLAGLSFVEQYLGGQKLISEYASLPVNTLKLMQFMANAEKNIPAEYTKFVAELEKSSIYDQASRGEMLLQRYAALKFSVDVSRLRLIVVRAQGQIATICRHTSNVENAMASARAERYYERAISILENAIRNNPQATNLAAAEQYLQKLRQNFANAVIRKHTENVRNAIAEARKSSYYESAINKLRDAIKNNPQATNLAEANSYLERYESLLRQKKQRLAVKQAKIDAMTSDEIRQELISFIDRWLREVQMKRATAHFWRYQSLGEPFFNVRSWQILGSQRGYWNRQSNTVVVQVDSSNEAGWPIKVNWEVYISRDDELDWKIFSVTE